MRHPNNSEGPPVKPPFGRADYEVAAIIRAVWALISGVTTSRGRGSETFGKVLQPDEADKAIDRAFHVLGRSFARSRPEADIAADGQPRKQAVVLEHHAALGPRASIGAPDMKACPRVGDSNPATIRSNVDFPHPDAPIRQTNSPLLTRK
jgi:hypothetical protein